MVQSIIVIIRSAKFTASGHYNVSAASTDSKVSDDIYSASRALGAKYSAAQQQLDIELNTVDAFQGREKDFVIFSCVR